MKIHNQSNNTTNISTHIDTIHIVRDAIRNISVIEIIIIYSTVPYCKMKMQYFLITLKFTNAYVCNHQYSGVFVL